MRGTFRWLLGQAPGALPPKEGATSRQLTPEQEALAAAIARQTMSPFCPGRTLADCPSEYAAAWRRDIRTLLGQGHSPAEVQDELERRAGANLSGIPARDTSYWVPAAFGLFGVAVLGAIFVRLRSSSARNERSAADGRGPDSIGATVGDERLEAELAAEDEEDR